MSAPRTLAGALALAALAAAATPARAQDAPPGRAPLRESIALVIPWGDANDTTRFGDEGPSTRSANTALGRAFAGRDGRIYVWDAAQGNLKLITLADDGHIDVRVTPRVHPGGAPPRIVDAVADADGDVVLLGSPAPDTTCADVFGLPAGGAWTELAIPAWGGWCALGGVSLRDGARLDVAADGTVRLRPLQAAGNLALVAGEHGRMRALDALTLDGSPETDAAPADMAGRRVTHTANHGVAVLDRDGRVLATGTLPDAHVWRTIEGERLFLRPDGSVIALAATSRGVAIYRLATEGTVPPRRHGPVLGPKFKPQDTR